MSEFSKPVPRINLDAGKQSPKFSRLAIASLVCGILSIVFSLLTAIAACVMGIIAISTINKSDGRLKGKGLAITGMALSILLSLASITTMWFVREFSREAVAQNNVRQLAIAMHNYESTFRNYPNDILDRESGKPLLSWRVAILPYLEYQSLYEQFRLDEPWDSPTNLEAAKNIPEVLKRHGAGIKEGFTTYQRPVGNGAFFDASNGRNTRRIKMMDIRDGTSKTFLIVETSPDAAVFWSQPKDYNFDPSDPPANLGASKFGWLLFAMGDGSTIRLKRDLVTSDQLNSMFTRSGEEIIDANMIKPSK